MTRRRAAAAGKRLRVLLPLRLLLPPKQRNRTRPWSFSTYVSKRGYHLWDLPTYSAALQETGFADVVAEDRTGAFEACLKSELEKAEADREAFVRDFSEEDFEEVVGAWRAKLTRVAKGQQRWGLFVARKPL